MVGRLTGLSEGKSNPYDCDVGETVESRAELDRLAAKLSVHADYKVLRRIAPTARFTTAESPIGKLSIGVVVDVETTGLDCDSDRIIELAVQRFKFDEAGRIFEVGEPRSWLEDPERPLDREIVKLTGLTDGDVKDQAIDESIAGFIIVSADLVIAHNASFDRPFLERRLPAIAGKPWACSCNDVDWRELGFDGRSLSHLLMQCGWFHNGHRAGNDVLATLYLLAHQLAPNRSVLKALIDEASEPTCRIRVVESPIGKKDALRARAYRWNPSARVWWREVKQSSLATEQIWLENNIYTGGGKPEIEEIDWTRRHA